LSDRVGKNRTTITNYLRLLKLPPSVQNAIKDKQISMGHARALAGMQNPMFQLDLLKRIVENGLSVRDTERLASKSSSAPGKGPKPGASGGKPPTLPDEYKRIQEDLSRHFGIKKLGLKLTGKDKGQISIPFQSVDELNRILDLIENK
jgi:ParB family chromosome partitioning protein